MGKIFIIIFVLLFSMMNAYALQDEEFFNCTSNLIYDSCKGTDIQLKDNFFLDFGPRQTWQDKSNRIKQYKQDDSPIVVMDLPSDINIIKKLEWPKYNLTDVMYLVGYMIAYEPYAPPGNYFTFKFYMKQNGKNLGLFTNEGENILTCGNNELDIYISDYYWNNMKIECKNYTITYINQTIQEYNLIKIIFSIFSYVKNTEGGIIFIFTLITIGAIFSICITLAFIFRIKIKKSLLYISQKIFKIDKSKDSSEPKAP